MTIFDAATRDDCTVKRQKTSTPLQALVMLNDPQINEASRVLSTKILKDNNTSNEDRITRVFRMITSRFPTDKELDDLGAYLSEIKEAYKGNLEGVSAENYAYTSLVSLIFNLDEALVKG